MVFGGGGRFAKGVSRGMGKWLFATQTGRAGTEGGAEAGSVAVIVAAGAASKHYRSVHTASTGSKVMLDSILAEVEDLENKINDKEERSITSWINKLKAEKDDCGQMKEQLKEKLTAMRSKIKGIKQACGDGDLETVDDSQREELRVLSEECEEQVVGLVIGVQSNLGDKSD